MAPVVVNSEAETGKSFLTVPDSTSSVCALGSDFTSPPFVVVPCSTVDWGGLLAEEGLGETAAPEFAEVLPPRGREVREGEVAQTRRRRPQKGLEHISRARIGGRKLAQPIL